MAVGMGEVMVAVMAEVGVVEATMVEERGEERGGAEVEVGSAVGSVEVAKEVGAKGGSRTEARNLCSHRRSRSTWIHARDRRHRIPHLE